jgi:dTDP-4-dehydrorhamnose reductase
VRILIFGAGGQLATALEKALAGEEVRAPAHTQVDICDATAAEECARSFRPHCMINTAAFHRVDDCEDQVERSFAVNAVAVGNLARTANELDAALVHFSTDYVFDGAQRKPYRETDIPNPLSVYAISKLAGELIVRQYVRRYFLVRTCGLYGSRSSRGKGGNFVDTMLRLGQSGQPIRVVRDQVATPTSAGDLARSLAPLLRTEKYGLYHMTNCGECSWFDFALEIFRLANLQPDVKPVSSAEFGSKARRPPYSVLDHVALRQAGFPELPPWQEALAGYIDDRKRLS